MYYLALQIGKINHVIVYNSQRANAGSRKIHQQWSTEPASTNNQNFCVQQFPLTLAADLGRVAATAALLYGAPPPRKSNYL